MTKPTSDRVKRASAGMDEDIVRLADRLKTSPDGEVMDDELRHLEALLFAAAEPIDVATLRERMGEDCDVGVLIARLARDYAGRGINLVTVAGRWRFQTAPDLERHLVDIKEAPRKLSRAALETLSIIAYHQPVTRAEIEDVRGVAVSKGTIDVLMELSWVRIRGRRRTPGRPVTYGTSEDFLAHFNLEEITDLPGREELKAAGLLDSRLPKDFEMPTPMLSMDIDEDAIEDEDDTEFVMDFMSDDVAPNLDD
ncbi:MAG: SMC-Scp complex subunit ScpB [Robiginitomaculum sp.]